MKKSVRVIISGGVCLACTCSLSQADTRYVDISNPTPTAPYTTWATAATDIQTAVDAAIDGDMVLVADGIYEITSKIGITKGLTITGTRCGLTENMKRPEV